MDFAKFKQAIEDARRHIDAGDKEAAIALFGERMGVDRTAAAAAVEHIAAGEAVTITESSVTGSGDAGRTVEQIMAAIRDRGLGGNLFKLMGSDLSKFENAFDLGGDGERVVTTRTTVRTSGIGGGRRIEVATLGDNSGPATLIDAAPAADAPAPALGPASGMSPRHVNVIERQRGRTVERPRRGGTVVVVIVMAVIVGIALAFLLR